MKIQTRKPTETSLDSFKSNFFNLLKLLIARPNVGLDFIILNIKV